jgi:type IV pilus assembly protein PilA
MPPRRSPPRSPQRGFTLIELLITIAIIAVLSGIAIVMYRKYIHAAQSAEAKTTFGLIRNGEEAYRAEMLGYLSCSGSLTDYYPNASPDDSRWVWERPNDTRYNNTTNGWQMLNVHPDAPVRYGYAVVAGVAPGALPTPDPLMVSPPVWPSAMQAGQPWYVIMARNQHFQNDNNWLPHLLVTTSYDASIYAENEGN